MQTLRPLHWLSNVLGTYTTRDIINNKLQYYHVLPPAKSLSILTIGHIQACSSMPSPKSAPSRDESGLHTCFHGPHDCTPPNGTLTGSAVFAGLTNVTNTQKHTHTDHATRVATGDIYHSK